MTDSNTLADDNIKDFHGYVNVDQLTEGGYERI